MGIYDRNYYRDDQSGSNFFAMSSGGTGGRSMVIVLIAINVAVFVVDAFTDRAAGQIGQLCDYLSLSTTDAAQPWYWFRLLTAAFSHASASHIFGNMLVLFFFGRPIESLYGSKRFLWMYLTASLCGNAIWLFAQLMSGQPGSVLGASGATTAVFILFCIHYPNQKIFLLFFPFFGIPAWIMGILFVGQDILGQLGLKQSNVAFLVHLVGAAYAFLFFKTRWSFGELIPAGFSTEGLTKSLKPKPNLRVHRPDDQPPAKDDKLAQQADKILKKLHEQGEASLTARERRILEEYSRSIKQRK